MLSASLRQIYPELTEYSPCGAFIKHKNVEIPSLERFITEISKFPKNANFFGRGHTNVNYIAFPSLFRERRFYKNEYMMYQELVIRCPDSFVHCSSHLDFLVEMQHYGLPTRLLDITSNPLIALYFACENGDTPGEVLIYEVHNNKLKYEKCDEVAILSSLPMFSFEKQKILLNLLKKGVGLIVEPPYLEFVHEVRSERPAFQSSLTLEKVINPVFVKPIRNNQRISHQEGAFIIWGLDESFYSNDMQTDKNKLRTNDYRYFQDGKKIVFYIQAQKKREIIERLNRIGINKAYIYPEIDDVAEYIKSSQKSLLWRGDSHLVPDPYALYQRDAASGGLQAVSDRRRREPYHGCVGRPAPDPTGGRHPHAQHVQRVCVADGERIELDRLSRRL